MTAACPMCAVWEAMVADLEREVERLRSRRRALPPFTGAAAGGARFWPTDKARALLDASHPDAA